VNLVSRWTTVGGLPLHVRAGGTSTEPPFVLVHGLGVSGRYFAPLGVELAREARVLVPDLPGSGRSAKPPRPLAISGLTGALAAFLDAEGIDRCRVIANSLGCQLAAELALRRPHQVAALALVGPAVDPTAPGAVRELLRLISDAPREPPQLVGIALSEYALFGPRRLVATGYSMLDYRLEHTLPRVFAPTLVLRGEHDPIAPQRWVEQAAALLPRGRAAVVRGAAHACHFSHPATVAELVLAFFEEAEHAVGQGVGSLEHRDVSRVRNDDEARAR
jgi:2-hydroxy-6-oxonona-2,4-dienedioate hydrolase